MTLTILIALVVLVTSVVASALLAPSGRFIERDAFRRQFRGPLEPVRLAPCHPSSSVCMSSLCSSVRSRAAQCEEVNLPEPGPGNFSAVAAGSVSVASTDSKEPVSFRPTSVVAATLSRSIDGNNPADDRGKRVRHKHRLGRVGIRYVRRLRCDVWTQMRRHECDSVSVAGNCCCIAWVRACDKLLGAWIVVGPNG